MHDPATQKRLNEEWEKDTKKRKRAALRAALHARGLRVIAGGKKRKAKVETSGEAGVRGPCPSCHESRNDYENHYCKPKPVRGLWGEGRAPVDDDERAANGGGASLACSVTYKGRGFFCSRAPGHEGDHIAGSVTYPTPTDIIYARWAP